MPSSGALPHLTDGGGVCVILENYRPVELALQGGRQTKPIEARNIRRFNNYAVSYVNRPGNNHRHSREQSALGHSLTFTATDGIDQSAHNLVWLLDLRCWLHLPAINLAVSIDRGHAKMCSPEVRREHKLGFSCTRSIFGVNRQLPGGLSDNDPTPHLEFQRYVVVLY